MTTQQLELTEKLFNEINSADRILIGAGAGLSASAGLSYLNEEVFKKYFPEMHALGYHYQYELVGMSDDDWSLGRKWAYWSTHINYVRNIFPSAELYHTLLSLLEGKDWFVVTSNADRQFMRAGFPMERVFEFQGSYDNLGCSKRCTRETWLSLPPLARAREGIDRETFECVPDAIPRCPYCGEPAEVCFRPSNYKEGQQRYIDFVEGSERKKLCMIEMGVGFNTPGVIRWPFERICYAIPGAKLFRINKGYEEYVNHEGYPQIPKELDGKAFSLNCDCAEVINYLFDKQYPANV
ncbi:MAG: hypothetical protein MJ067_02155 [Oscillospiraceae bacterium]|nr:hypothetical protein [Oscillospiraceae bacterium]